MSANASALVRTDRRALGQILTNLVGNAIKSTPRGSVRIELGQPQVNSRRMAAIAVSETGVGIQAEDLPRLFRAFERLQIRRARRERG